MAQIVLPVSLGEALDKLTILDIKLSKIQDSRRNDVEKEYNALLTSLKKYVDAYPYHYRILKEINTTLWEIQDEFHGKDLPGERAAEIARRILLENDRRFRVKLKINTLANSELKEQKGYAAKRAIVYTHLGLGDMFWMNGAVRYLATCYDEVLVICKERNKLNAGTMYMDDSTIKIVVVTDDADLHPWPQRRAMFEQMGYTVYGCGAWAPRSDPVIYNLPESFYRDMNMPHSFRTTYFHIPRVPAAAELAAKFTGRPYIVVHQQSSVQTLPIVETLRAAGETRLILDLNKNQYESTQAEEHALAELVVGRPLIEYTDLIEGAAEIHMIESSIYCMASHLDLSRVGRKLCYEPWGGNAERLGIFETGHI
jgi:hypothetical protein